MEIIPAIDLRRGRCVRLYQGDYDKETVFSESPLVMALHWRNEGATRLHLVDLDGALEGRLCNSSVVQAIAQATDIPVEAGGGVRQLETVEHLLNLGAGRVILGTAAIEDPYLVGAACRRFGDAIIVSVDAQDGYVRGHGWRAGSSLTVGELIRRMEDLGVKRFIYTDISRDGTLSEPNYEAVKSVLAQTELPIIAAGGISAVEHVTRLAALGVEAAIIGRALYTGDIELKEALAAISAQPRGSDC